MTLPLARGALPRGLRMAFEKGRLAERSQDSGAMRLEGRYPLQFGSAATVSQPFGLADDGFRIGQFRGIGNTVEEVFVLRLAKRVVAFVSKCLDTLIPCQKHVFSKIAKPGVLSDGFMDMGSSVGDGLAD